MPEVTPIKDLKGYLEAPEVERLIAAATNRRDALLVRIPWRSGIRVSELIGIKVPDIDFKGRAILIKIQKQRKRDGKTIERRRLIPIDQGTLDMVREYLEWRKQFPYKGDLLFPITRQRVDQIFWRLGRRAGIKEIGDPTISKHRKLHPHHLRHCLHPDTRILTPEGIYTAKQIYENSTGELLHKPLNRVVSISGKSLRPCSSVVTSRSKHTSQLLTIEAGGYELTCSPEHRLFTVDADGLKEVKAKEVTIEQYLVGVSSISWTVTEKIGVERSRLLGYFVGDGNLLTRGIMFTEKTKDIVDFYVELLRKLYPARLKIKGKGYIEPHIIHDIIHGDSNSYKVTFNSTAVARWLKSMGLDKHSRERRVPAILWRAEVEDICQFLAGYYDAEGSAGRYTSASKCLLQDVQILLLRLGILSSLSGGERTVTLPRGNTIKQKQYVLYISNQNRFLFYIPTLKRLSWRATDERKLRKIPMQEFVVSLYRGYTGQLTPLAEQKGIKHLARYKKICALAETARKIVGVKKELGGDTRVWEKVLSSPLVFHKVQSITQTSGVEQEVYDFGTSYGNLITNGFLSHNSFAIHCIKRGMTIERLQKILGHSSPTTTSVYLQYSLKDLHESYDEVWKEDEATETKD
ncbi:MAG: tyrosine-type recombinase/integrase [Desulfobacterales bacterium]|nr:tyrosine-type recombinase/integrase [Desulfobacterales bacterium]